MDEQILKEERQKLKDILTKMDVQEHEIEDYIAEKSTNFKIENMAEANVMASQVKKLDDIKKIKDKPYFARMDFKENGKNEEAFYIGKISLLDSKTAYPIIVDWRAPIANLYYEGKLGKASYECLGEQIEGEINLKRQYVIEKQKLLKYVDINVTGNDELLDSALEEKADDRLKNIVATIQDEQNKIIRAGLDKPLIVQGVAGSGKTTIALHRIAYLIYNYEKQFKPDEFMIIAPTRFFLNYISNILPDLGVDDVKQCTFEDFAYDVIGKKLKISDSNEKLVIIVNKDFDDINKGNTDTMIKEAKYKSSLKFKEKVDEYLYYIENNYIPKEDFYFMNHLIMKQNDIDYLFKHTYKMYNFSARINEIEKNMVSELNRKSEKIIDELRAERTRKIVGLVGKERADLYDEYDRIIKLLEKGQKKIVKEYLDKIPKMDSVKYYKDFIDNYLENSDEIMEYLKNNTSRNLSKNEISFEDLAPLMYIQIKIFGIKEKCKVKHVVIDEAQDYGEFQFDVLKNILNSNSMTILGDIAQGVHYYRGIENWKRFIDVEFNDVKTTYTTLSKTYRTTKEIMNVANSVINKLPEYEKEFIVLGDPVIDRKNSIYMKKCDNENDIIMEINERINTHINSGYKSIAIIAKDMKECEELEKKLSKLRADVKLIKGKDSEYNAGISIVPSYLAKGLEFDCVIISNANKEKYLDNSLDIKLLYVTITRAMSKLDVLYIDKLTDLIDE